MVGIDLIPQSARFARARRRHVKAWASALGAAAALLAVPLVIAWSQHADIVRLRRRADELQSGLAVARGKLRTLTATAKATLTRLDRAKALRSKRAWSSILAVIDERMTPGSWLTSIATDPKSPSARGGSSRKRRTRGKEQESKTSVTIEAPRKLRIAGYATAAGEPHQLVRNLKSSGIFTAVTLEDSRREPALDASYYRFEVVCEW